MEQEHAHHSSLEILPRLPGTCAWHSDFVNSIFPVQSRGGGGGSTSAECRPRENNVCSYRPCTRKTVSLGSRSAHKDSKRHGSIRAQKAEARFFDLSSV